MTNQLKPPTIGQVLAAQVEHTRQNRGWSKQRLTERLEEIGTPIDRMAVTRIEDNSRRVEVGEAVALAAALDVPLWWLLVPIDSESPVQVGSYIFSSGHVLAFIWGDQPLDLPGGDPGRFLFGIGAQDRNLLATALRSMLRRAQAASSAAELQELSRQTAAMVSSLEAVFKGDVAREEAADRV
jgi:transcriptional regulator with XRE-family HTH domain